jgi:hypothetical protein
MCGDWVSGSKAKEPHPKATLFRPGSLRDFTCKGHFDRQCGNRTIGSTAFLVAGENSLYLDQLEVGIDHPSAFCGRYLIDPVAVYVVPQLDVKPVHVVKIDPVLAVLSNNQKGGVVPNVPGFFVES